MSGDSFSDVVIVDVTSVGIQGPPGPQGPLGAGTFPDAPTDGTTYGRQSGAWVGVLPLADAPVTVLHFGADPSGVADSTAAFQAALATGGNVYVPAGSYLIKAQLTLGNGQEMYGDGRGLTTLLIDQTFSPTATGVISLTGREQLSPCVRDFAIRFAQPSDQSSRANFKTLAAGGTSGTGGTGVMYPPAIIITTANRFRIYRLRISRAWNGIANAAGNTIGGFFIRDIEISALNVGLALDNSFDFGHISGWHHWSFDLSPSLVTVSQDGNMFAARFGDTGEVDGINITDFSSFVGRMAIRSATWMSFTNLNFDNNSATLEISGGQFIQIANVYFTGSSAGTANPNAQLTITGGNVFIVNHRASSAGPLINVSGGALLISGGQLVAANPAGSIAVQSGGLMEIKNTQLSANTGAGAWTVPLINVTGGNVSFTSNRVTSPSVGDVGALVIATDSVYHSVADNYWNGWQWVSPGPLGSYGFNQRISNNGISAAVQYGDLGAGDVARATAVNLRIATVAGQQRAVLFQSGINLRWALAATGGSEPADGSNVGADFSLSRYNDAGVFQGSPISITRSSGVVRLSDTGNVITTGVLPTDMAPALGTRLLGIQSSGASVGDFDLITTSDTTNMRQLFRRSRGTPTAPTAVQLNDILGETWFGGYDGTAWNNPPAYIRVIAAATWSTSAHDTSILFGLTTGTTLVPALVLTGTLATVNVPIAVGSSGGPTIRAGTGAATGTQPKGSQWLRTDGAVGSTLYVSQGAGVWNAVAGV